MHTNTLVSEACLLRGIDGMNVTKANFMSKHFAVDKTNEELLHLFLKRG